MKHSRAESVRVSLIDEQAAVILEIEDNGVGFNTAAGSGEKQGFRNMRDRAASVGAAFSQTSTPGRGTRIRVELPTEGD
jgi:signal transduction histidine kinase